MIYIFQNIRTPVGQEVNTLLNDFDYIAQRKPYEIKEQITANKDGKKPVPDQIKNNLPYFFSGKLIEGKRTKNKVKYKSLIILDIERDKNDSRQLKAEAVKKIVFDALSNYRYILYPTINNQPNYARFRLILDPTTDMQEQDSIATTEEIKDLLEAQGLPIDPSCKDYTRINGLPVDNGLTTYEVIRNNGIAYPVKKGSTNSPLIKAGYSKHTASSIGQENLTKPDIKSYIDERLEAIPTEIKNAIPVEQTKQKAINDAPFMFNQEQVHQYMTQYVAKYAEALKDRGNYVAVKMQIIKSYQEKLISLDSALIAMEIIALGDKDWIRGNRKEFMLERHNQNITTNYDIRTIIRAINEPVDEGLALNNANDVPKTMKEQFQLLDDIGKAWREDNKRVINQGKPNEYERIREMPYLTASKLLNKYANFCLIGDKHDKAILAFYDVDRGIYEASEILRYKLYKALDFRFSPQQWTKIDMMLKTEVRLKTQSEAPHLIPVGNGIYNNLQGKLLEFSPQYIFMSKIKTNYNPDAKKPIINNFDFDDWLNSIACNDKEVVTLLWQVINEAINPNRTRDKIGFLIGDGANGKGTFQRLLENLIGKENVSSLKPPDFADRFSKEGLIGKVCNIGDDISSAYIDEISPLMSIATGDSILIEAKGKSVISANLKLFCLFSGNAMPNVRNKSEGWYRRLLIIPFNADFKDAKNDPRIKEEYLANPQLLEYVLKKSIEMDFNHFIEPRAVKSMINEYKVDNDFYRSFVIEVFEDRQLERFKQLPNKYLKYLLQEYMRENGIKYKLPFHFVEPLITAINDEMGIKYVTGKPYYNSDYITTLPNMYPIEIIGGTSVRSIIKLSI